MKQGNEFYCKREIGNLKWKKVLVFLVAGLTMCIVPCLALAQGNNVSLTEDDCQKCHDKAVEDIEAKGGKHKTEVVCTDCHQGHPPGDRDIIPECNNCHAGKKHFELDDCLRCHSNPHAPLDLQMDGGITDPCLTCHTSQRKQLEEHESYHSQLDCSSCHHQHGLIPECMQCHHSHSEDMGQEDCGRCHQAHKPLIVTYEEDIPSNYCAACHQKAYDLLKANSTKHQDLNCVTCHQRDHKMIPGCQDCHSEPHPESMLSRFDTCGECHGNAHDLNSGRRAE
ncbi:MAG: cytochrome C [Desulfurivibrionaceae bacterium]